MKNVIEWIALLGDIDDAIKRNVATKANLEFFEEKEDDGDAENYEGEYSAEVQSTPLESNKNENGFKRSSLSTIGSVLKKRLNGNLDSCEKEKEDEDTESYEKEDSFSGKLFPDSRTSMGNRSSNSSVNGKVVPIEEDRSKTWLLRGAGCGSEGMLVWQGRKLIVNKMKKHGWRGFATEALVNAEACKIHYEGFSQFYDEMVKITFHEYVLYILLIYLFIYFIYRY